MAKAEGAPKKEKAKLTDKEQSERFKQAARDLEVDESGELFEGAMKKSPFVTESICLSESC